MLRLKDIKRALIISGLLVLSTFLPSCSEETKIVLETEKTETNKVRYIERNDWNSLLDTNNVIGSILIWDETNDIFYSNNFERADSGFIPASTFKIPNTLIGLELGILKADTTIFKWDGEVRKNQKWNKDLTVTDGFHASCVPCYRELARKIGLTNMLAQLKKMEYNSFDIDSSNLDLFWLVGEAKISQFQQINFLNRLKEKQLNLSENTYKNAFKIMETNQDNFRFLSKTGWSNNNIGWFVGYIIVNNKIFYFATNLEPKREIDFSARKRLTMKALQDICEF